MSKSSDDIEKEKESVIKPVAMEINTGEKVECAGNINEVEISSHQNTEPVGFTATNPTKGKETVVITSKHVIF